MEHNCLHLSGVEVVAEATYERFMLHAFTALRVARGGSEAHEAIV